MPNPSRFRMDLCECTHSTAELFVCLHRRHPRTVTPNVHNSRWSSLCDEHIGVAQNVVAVTHEHIKRGRTVVSVQQTSGHVCAMFMQASTHLSGSPQINTTVNNANPPTHAPSIKKPILNTMLLLS